ncbi:DUF4302 domain-containing protein [Chitinophaga polysaccharea]|uniref:DUF4302 domain-containing protein n=1 Tax=Chitinophaga polysaccharea TaxID=1293035 RepID=UPI00163C0114|nr:DUF4302 domain-containing protein [Chitinophaga polysaccharea]
MKRYLLYILLLLTFFSCGKNKDDSVFPETPDQRIEKVLKDYAAKLTAAPYGWKMKVIPAGISSEVRSYYFWMRFNDGNRVISRLDNEKPLESSYRLKALQRPELIFDTYTYLDDGIDPVSAIFSAYFGSEVELFDFEFEIISATTDSIILNGKYGGSKAILLRAAPTDSTNSSMLAPHAGTYNAVGRALCYSGPEPVGVPDIISIARRKVAVPLAEDNSILLDFSNKEIFGGMYRITFDPGTNKVTAVAPGRFLKKEVRPDSFKMLTFSSDPVLKQIYLKSSYINLDNQYCEVEETLTLK